MNQKQKLGYTLLGAGIMAVGITIGQVITPNIEAQSNGVFDEITCRSLNVVDRNGNTGIHLLAAGDLNGSEGINLLAAENTNAIVIGNNSPGTGRIYLSTDHGTNGITITDGAGNSAIELTAKEHQNHVQVFDKAENMAILLNTHEDANAVTIFGKAEKPAILLSAIESENHLFVARKGGEGSVKLVGTKDRSGVSITSSKTEQIRLMAVEDANMIFLTGKAGEERIGLLTPSKMGPSIFITDRAGNPVWSTYRKD